MKRPCIQTFVRLVMKTAMLCLLLTTAGFNCRARADNSMALFPIIQDGKLGYINRDGKMVIQPESGIRGESGPGRYFVEGLEPVSIDNPSGGLPWTEQGYLDESGRVAIAPRFSLALPFSEGLAAVRDENGNYGYIDHAGEYVIEPQFDDASSFSEGFARVGLDHLAGYIDHLGGFIVKPQYKSWSPRDGDFSEGLACVEVNGLWGFINTNGETVIEPRFNQPTSFSHGLAPAKDGDLYGYINKTGAFAIQPRFNLAWQFSEGLARVEIRGEMAFINTNGNLMFSVTNGDWGDEFSEGMVNVAFRQRGGPRLWGYVDRIGRTAIAPRFQEAEPFWNGLAKVVIDSKAAYIDKSGGFVWGPEGFNESLSRDLLSQTSETQRLENNREILRLAALIDPRSPPLTFEKLSAGAFEHDVFDERSRAFAGHANADPKNVEALLLRLLDYALPATNYELMPDLARMQEDNIRRKAAKALVAMPAPDVVPVLRRWLSEGLAAARNGRAYRWSLLGEAMRGLGQFRDKTMITQLVAAWDDGTFDNIATSSVFDRPGTVKSDLRQSAVTALCEMPSAECRALLLEAMKTNEFGHPLRCMAAAALVRIDEQAGRDFLLRGFELYLDGLDGTPASLEDSRQAQRNVYGAYARFHLQSLGDDGLIAELKSMIDTATPGTKRNNMNSLLQEMRIAGLPLEELKRMAGEEKDLNKRLPAIRALGQRGGPDLLPFLESVAARTNDHPREPQNEMLIGSARAALKAIRQHHWHELDRE